MSYNKQVKQHYPKPIVSNNEHETQHASFCCEQLSYLQPTLHFGYHKSYQLMPRLQNRALSRAIKY